MKGVFVMTEILGEATGMFPWAIYVIPAIFALGALIGAIDGFRQGISRGIIRLITIIASAVLAIFTSRLIYSKLMEAFAGMTIEDIYNTLSQYIQGVDLSIILNFDVETAIHIIAIPFALILIPLMFTLIFLLATAITKLIHVILCGIFGLSIVNNNFLTKTLGLFFGLVQGVVVTAIVLMPIIGFASSVSTAVDTLNEKTPEDPSTVQLTQMYNTYVKDFADTPITNTVGKLGVNDIYRYIVTVDVCGKETDMTSLIPDASMLYVKGASLKGFNWKAPTEANKTTLRQMNEVLEGSSYFSDISAGLVRGASKSITSGNFPLSFPEPFNTMVNGALEIFHTATSDNLHTDVDTLLDVYFLLADKNVLNSLETDSDQMLTLLTEKDADGKTTINLVVDRINSNERMKPLVTLFTKLSISIMGNQLGLGEETVEAYTNVKDGLNDALAITKEGKTEEEYIEEVSASLDATLKENNIEIEKEIVDSMATYISDNYTAGDTLTDEEMNDIILNYYDAYLEYMETGKLPPEIPELP